MKKALFIFLLINIWATMISAQKTEKNKDIAPTSEEVFLLVEEMPLFPGCEDKKSKKEKEECSTKKLYRYIYENLKYPELALNKGIEGKVTLRFEVKKDSSVSNIMILKDIGGGCGDAAKKVIESMNKNHIKWIPGKQGKKDVNVWYSMQVFFRLKDAQKQKIKKSNVEELSIVVDQMPIFPGCENKKTIRKQEECSSNKLYRYIYSHLTYPEWAKRNGIEGTVILKFEIKKDGSISGVEILKDIGYGCGKAAKKAIESMNKNHIKWIPGKQNGRDVSVWYTTPVIFRLSSKKR